MGLFLKPCNEGGSRDERMKRFFSVISLLCSHGFLTDKKGGDLIGTAEMGHWGGKKEDVKIWMRLGFYGKEREVKEILEQSHRKRHETRISLTFLRHQARSYTFTYSMQCSEGSDTTHQPNRSSALHHLSPTSCQGCSAVPRRRSYFPFGIASPNFNHSS